MGVRLTSARQAILDELKEAQRHLTALDIHQRLQDRLPSLNLSTVYRSLDYLVENHLISISDMGLGSPVYERVDKGIHHHLVCQKCGRVIELSHETVAPFFQSIAVDLDFKIRTNHLVLYGVCQECQG